MKICISGSGGFIGSALTAHLKNLGHIVSPVKTADLALDESAFAAKFNGAEAVINLAGAPIIGRWSEEYKKKIYESRVFTTSRIIKAISSLNKKPEILISASAVGIYDNKNTYGEENAQYADDFLAKVCKDWENEAQKARGALMRTAIFRFGVILGANGGALGQMLLPFKMGLGGKIGDGRQHFSWIELSDAIRAFEHIVNNKGLDGVFNITSPNPVTNAVFTETLARVLNRPSFLSLPSFALNMIFSEGAKVLTDGQSAIPARLLKSGFKFNFPELENALKHILKAN